MCDEPLNAKQIQIESICKYIPDLGRIEAR